MMHNKEITITVNTKELREKLIDNRNAHSDEFLAALEAWKSACLDELRVQRAVIQELSLDDMVAGKGHCRVHLERPRSFAEDYDRAIQMLEWHEGDTIVLDQDSFKKYVQNEWDWMRSFKAVSATYLGE